MQAIATIAIPCRNGGAFLEPLLESLLRQTSQDFRLLLVDDASTDDSAGVARRICGDRIEIHENAAVLGLAGNWNRCVELVRTPTFCLAHMDDVYEPSYFERMVAALRSSPNAALAHCRAHAIDAAGASLDSAAEHYKNRYWRGLDRADRAEVYARLIRGNFIVCPSVLYRTAAWRAVGGADTAFAFAPDWKLWFRLLLEGFDFVAVPEALVAYRRHEASATSQSARDLVRYREEFEVLDFASTEGLRAGLIDERAARDRTALRNNVLHDAYLDLRRRDRPAARDKLAFLRERVPALRDDRLVVAFARLLKLGRVGDALIGVGLRAALLGARTAK